MIIQVTVETVIDYSDLFTGGCRGRLVGHKGFARYVVGLILRNLAKLKLLLLASYPCSVHCP